MQDWLNIPYQLHHNCKHSTRFFFIHLFFSEWLQHFYRPKKVFTSEVIFSKFTRSGTLSRLNSTKNHFLGDFGKFHNSYTAWKMSKYGDFSGPYFPAFGLNTERYGRYGKIRTRKNSAFGHFSHSVTFQLTF